MVEEANIFFLINCSSLPDLGSDEQTSNETKPKVNKHKNNQQAPEKTTHFLLAPAAILTRRGRFQFLVSLVAAFLSLPTELPKLFYSVSYTNQSQSYMRI